MYQVYQEHIVIKAFDTSDTLDTFILASLHVHPHR